MWRAEAPIQRQLMTSMLVTSTAALLFTVVAFAAYEFFAFRLGATEHLGTLGKVIAANSTAALAFNSPDDARETLAALRADPQIVAAALYGPDGDLFAAYPPAPAATDFPAIPGNPGYAIRGGFLSGFEPVVQGADFRVGTLYMRSDMSEIFGRLQLYALIASLVFALSVLMAFYISRWQQAQISRPILALAAAARRLFDERDYSARVDDARGPELRQLTDAINHMLGRLQLHEQDQRDTKRRIEAQLGRLELLNRITQAIGEREDAPSIFKVMLQNLEDSLPVEFCCICEHEPLTEEMTVARVGPRSLAAAAQMRMPEGARIPVGHNGLRRCLQGALVYEPDLKNVSSPFAARLIEGGFNSVVIAPLRTESQIVGLVIAARRDVNGFTSGECEFLRQASDHVALASHQTQLYNALQIAYDDLRLSQQAIMQQERLRALGQMSSGIAHDINNAISPIALYTESLLEREPGLSDRARANLRTIQQAVDDVANTVARMREFYRPREQQLMLAHINLNELVDQVKELTRAKWGTMPQERGIVIRMDTELEPGLPPIMGAASEIRDALTNLIFNAIDAMPQGGHLLVKTRSVSSQAHEHEPIRSAIVEVRDTGLGMSEETRRRCLEPFFTTKGERGTGLGLAMVFGMVQRHSAELEIDTALGSGTTMRLIFPAPSLTPAAVQWPRSAAAIKRTRVLVIDDDTQLIKSLREILEADGHGVTTAEGGRAGIDTFLAANQGSEPYGIVITDLGMPYVDGRKVAAAIRAVSRVPVILLTGWGQRLLDEEDTPYGVDRVLAKPPRLHDLRAALADLVTRDTTQG